MGTKGFHLLLGEAVGYLSTTPRTWIWGLLFGAAALWQSRVLEPFVIGLTREDQAGRVEDIFSTISPGTLEEGFGAGLILFVIFLARVLGKAQVIWLLGEHAPAAAPRPRTSAPQQFSWNILWRNFHRALSLELALVLFLALLASVCFLPPLAALRWNPAAFEPLFLMSLIILVSLALLSFLISEFALLYRLLGRLSVRSSFENASLLFRRFTGRSLLFGCYVLALLFLFTFCLDLLILIFGALGLSFVSPILSLLVLGASSLLYQALWFFYFRDLASPPMPAAAGSSLTPDAVPETPPLNHGT